MGQWRVAIAETLTGNVVADVTPRDMPSFSRKVTDKGTWTVNVMPEDRNNQFVDLHTLTLDMPKYCWVIAHDELIVQAGPVVTPSYDENTRTLSVTGGGIQSLFDRRVLRNAAGTVSTIASADNTLTLNNLSLRGVAASIVNANMAQAGYSLPIDVPFPESGGNTRTYQGWDLAMVWDRLDELSKVENGPELDFRPYFVSGANQVRWEMVIGSPLLGDQNSNAVWDYGGALTQIDLDVNGSAGPVTRAFVKGSGSESATLVGYAESADMLSAGYPGLDYVDSDHFSVTEKDTLVGYANADIQAFAGPTQTWKCTVYIDGTNARGIPVAPALGTWDIGDRPMFGVYGHPFLADGMYRHRIMGYSDATESTVALTLQSVVET
jgi:hypothetical protein